MKRQAARRGGFTLAETLVTLLILLLVSGSMAGGLAFAARQYRESSLLSEAKLLCSTLTNVIQSELANTNQVTLGAPVEGKENCFAVESFTSDNYGGEDCALLPTDEYGKLTIGGNRLLSDKAYTSHDFGARVSVEYDTAGKIFAVTLSLRAKGATEDTLTSGFDVLPLNDVEVK